MLIDLVKLTITSFLSMLFLAKTTTHTLTDQVYQKYNFVYSSHIMHTKQQILYPKPLLNNVIIKKHLTHPADEQQRFGYLATKCVKKSTFFVKPIDIHLYLCYCYTQHFRTLKCENINAFYRSKPISRVRTKVYRYKERM